MLYLGQSITNPSDILQPITEEQVYLKTQQPDPPVADLLRNLQVIRTIDIRKYTEMKRRLPYLVCGTFNPAVRRTENFAYIDSFIIDIDHITEKGLDISHLREFFKQDERVSLCFLSPSGDGLKLHFHLSEKCYDYGLFSLFYKAFGRKLSEQYGLEQVIDSRTSDVTRACFISFDPQIYYNPCPLAVTIEDYVNTQSVQDMFEQKRLLEKENRTDDAVSIVPKISVEPDQDAILRIKEILQLKKTKAEKQPAFVPQQLNDIIEGLQEFLKESGLTITNIRDIQYGKQIHSSLGMKQTECNIFFGKRGFTVVQSPKAGTNAELNALTQELIQLYLYSI